MAIDNSFMIKKVEKFDSIFVLYSALTHQPFIECDDETFDDQVYIFTTQEMTQTFSRRYTSEKILLQAVQIPNKMIKGFFKSLYLLGVNAVMIQEEGAPVRVQLSQLAEAPDMEAMRNGKVPEANPELQLTGIYFMQELMRPIDRNTEEKRRLHDLEEEMAHNLLQARLIITVDTSDIEGKWNPKDRTQKVKVPMVKNKNGKTYQPVFTDLMEVKKFNQQNKQQKRVEMIPVTYDKIGGFLVKESEGVVFNPAGFNLILNREQLKLMAERYKQEEDE